ncbi:sensor histidine kinase [Hyalangium sp.]|uniref:sensor histidine kinase n=1 Tax=Hyalangium sp. TaxID=2028555 RepID=UPI002D73510C|nr:PhnD/SsuA/transferrin family substrate-binding protein [Hyalangium sp.]HYH96264.1 PhnD/SsuA/transferrin family substrate-binding protein [Hyalangium sp.]
MKEQVRAEFFGRALSRRVGRPVIVEQARTYENVEQEVAAGRVDMALATAEQCNFFEPQSRAVLRAVRAGRWYYHSAFICRVGESLTLEKLRGRRAAWVDPLSTAGYLLPKRHLESLGLPPSELFAEQRFYGTYRQALLAVLAGEADVTTFFTTHMEEYMVRALLAERVGPEERKLRPFAFSAPTLADGLIITSRMPEAEAARVVSAITAMSHDEGGLEPVLAPFDIQGFALVRGTSFQAPTPRGAVNSEYVTLDVDAQERCRRVWSSTGTALGRKLRSGEGLSLMELLPPEAGIPLESLVRSTRLNHINGRMHFRMETSGQTRLYVAEATLRPAGPGEQEPDLGLLVRDITDLDSLEQELYRLASFPLLHPDPMLEMGREGQVRYANPPAHTRFPDLLELGADHPLVATALAYAHRNAPDEGPAQVQIHGQFWEVVATQLQDHESLRVFAKDVTTRKQMEASLMQADRLASLGQLAAKVGHYMNNPLAFLMANLSFAREEIGRLREALRTGREEVDPEEITEVLDALSESVEGAERLKGIVQDLRLLTREAPRHRARVDVHPVLEDTLKLVRGELRHRARLDKDFQPVPPVEADEARLGQVFLNLMLNAVQAMSEQDAARNVLRVATRMSEAGEVLIEVQDTGAGMTPEVLSSLFEPFFTTRHSSTGMGLSVSHAIVTSLGGTLRADSQPGVGTLFTISLPAAGNPVASPPHPEHELAS